MDIETSPKLIIRRILGSLAIELSHRQTWTLGRDEACDIVVQDTWVSRKHASIICDKAGEFYFEDLGSRNGSTINGQEVLSPQRLQDGDLLVLGTTEIEFRNQVEFSCPPEKGTEMEQEDSSPLATPTLFADKSATPEIVKSVLITQMHSPQRDIWQALLTSQGLAVQIEPSYPDLQEYLADYQASGQPLPDLLMIDIETYPSNSYAFCRWCSREYPKLKIILISSKRTEIFPVERQWAIYQGAHDLMPGIQEATLMADVLDTVAKIEQVFKALNVQPRQQRSIMTTLLDLQNQIRGSAGKMSN